jgi:hypothetical protein
VDIPSSTMFTNSYRGLSLLWNANFPAQRSLIVKRVVHMNPLYDITIATMPCQPYAEACTLNNELDNP